MLRKLEFSKENFGIRRPKIELAKKIQPFGQENS